MLAYLASLLQDICDYGFPAGRSAHALMCSFMEEGRLNWLDLYAVQKVCGRLDQHSSSATGNVDRGTARRRLCKNYNSGNCRQESSHLNNCFLYEHFSTFCATKGSKFNQSEQNCRNKGKSEGKANNVSPH